MGLCTHEDLSAEIEKKYSYNTYGDKLIIKLSNVYIICHIHIYIAIYLASSQSIIKLLNDDHKIIMYNNTIMYLDITNQWLYGSMLEEM